MALPGPHGLNLDLLEEIFSHLAPSLANSQDDQKEARRTLLRIALLSRELAGRALHVLWRSMDSILPLLLLIPQFKQTDGQYILSGDVSKISWTRLDFYATKIQQFKYRVPYPTIPINPATYACISRLRGSESILPNLRSLLIDLENDRKISSIYDLENLLTSIIAGPTLRSVEVRGWQHKQENVQLQIFPPLSTLLTFCNNIQFVEISGYASASVLGAISSFPDLHSLRVPLLTFSESQYTPFVQRLGQLSHLQELSMNLPEGGNGRYNSSGFSSLRRLVLKGDIASLVSFVSQIETTALLELHLQMRCQCYSSQTAASPLNSFASLVHLDTLHATYERDIRSLISRISEKWRKSIISLTTRLECNGVLAGFNTAAGFLISMADLTGLRSLAFITPAPQFKSKPTQAFSGFRSPTMDESTSTTRDNDDRHLDASKVIQHLVRLTQLQHLYLPCTYAMSLTNLHYLAFHLPKLQILRTKISIDRIPSSNSLHRLSHNLQTLDVGQSTPFPFENALQAQSICWHLHFMFPNLSNIICDLSPTWFHVKPMLTFIQDIKQLLIAGDEDPKPLTLPPIWMEQTPTWATASSTDDIELLLDDTRGMSLAKTRTVEKKKRRY